MKRSPLRRVSKKRAKQNREYEKLKAVWWDNWIGCLCPVMADQGIYREVTDLHHKNHREGNRLNDTKDWLAVSREGHDWIHAHPNEAREKGWLV